MADKDLITLGNLSRFKTKYDEVIQNIREVAEGKCKTFILSYNETPITKPTDGDENSFVTPYYTMEGDIITTYEQFLEYIGGENNNICKNDIFNSNEDEIAISIIPSVTPTTAYCYYLLDNRTVFPSIRIHEYANKGDIFLVKELDVPDRWISLFPSFMFSDSCPGYKLETSKVDLNTKLDKIQGGSEKVFAYINDNGADSAWEIDTGNSDAVNPIITKLGLPKYYKHIYNLNFQWSDDIWRTIQFIFYDRKATHELASSVLPNDTPFNGIIISSSTNSEVGLFVRVNRNTNTTLIELIGYGLNVHALAEPTIEGKADILL